MSKDGAGKLLPPGVGGWWPPPQLVDLHLHSLHLRQELLLWEGIGGVRSESAQRNEPLPARLIPTPAMPAPFPWSSPQGPSLPHSSLQAPPYFVEEQLVLKLLHVSNFLTQ